MNHTSLHKRYIFSLIGMLLTSFSVFAQNHVTISGYVTAKSTGESLIGATVYVPGKGLGTVTNNAGYYSLTLPAGQHPLSISYVGYIRKEMSIDAKRDTIINIKLQDQPNRELQAVEVYADRRSELNSMEVGRVHLSMKDLKRMPTFMGEPDLIKFAQLLPGVSKGYEGFSGMVVRGGNVDENLYLLDGNPMYNVNHLFGLFSTFNPDAIKSAELYKGSFPARFGGRLSSVMDVHTNDGNMQAYHGTFSIGLISSKASIEGPIQKGKTSFHASVRRTYLDIIAKPIIAIINKSEDQNVSLDYHFYDANIKVNHKLNDQHRFFLQLYKGSDIFGGSSKDDYGNNEYDKFKSDINWGNFLASLGWDYAVSSKLFARSAIVYTQYDSKIGNYNEEMYEGHKSSYKYSLNSGIQDAGFRTDWDFRPFNSHFIRFGGFYTHHTFKPNEEKINIKGAYSMDGEMTPMIKQPDEIIHSNEFSLYAEDEYSITPRLSCNLGARGTLIHVQKKNYFSIEPRLAFRAMLSDVLSLKASYSQMSQSVHLLQGSILSLPTDLWVPVTSNLRPMVSKQSALGVYWKHGDYEWSLEGYYKSMNHLLAYKDGQSVIFSDQSWQERVSSGEGRSYGIEAMVKKTSGKLTGWIAYTLSWADRLYPDGSVNRGNRFPDRFDNRHKLNIVGMYQLNSHIDFSAVWSLSSGNMVTIPLETYYDINGVSKPYLKERNNFRLPLYHRLDLNMNIYKHKKNGRMGIWTFGVYNAYMHHNALLVIKQEERSQNRYRDVLKSLSLFPIIPSISYTYKF